MDEKTEDRIFEALRSLQDRQAADGERMARMETSLLSIDDHLTKLNSKVAEHERINGERAVACALHMQNEQMIKEELIKLEEAATTKIVSIEKRLTGRLTEVEQTTAKINQFTFFARGAWATIGVIASSLFGIVAAIYHGISMWKTLVHHTP